MGQRMEHLTQFRHRGSYRVHLINERRERTRTIVKRGPEDDTERDYVRLLELPVSTTHRMNIDTEELRELSCWRKRLEEGLIGSSRRDNWQVEDFEILNAWKKHMKCNPSQTDELTENVPDPDEGNESKEISDRTQGICRKSDRTSNRRKIRKQKQKTALTLIKKERTETEILLYQTQKWKTKNFALSELVPKELDRRFRKWVQQCTGVSVDQQCFDRWTMTNLDIGDVSGMTCVLLSPGYDYKLPKRVQFDENDKLLSKCRLFKTRKRRFWNPNRRPHSRGIRLTMEKCLHPGRRDGKRTFWRFASVREAQSINFRTVSRSAYGIVSPRKHLNEFSKRDLLHNWKREQGCFNLYAQPIEDWAQMPQVVAITTPRTEPIQSQNPKELAKESRIYRDLRKESTSGVRN
jgi:hypothetical protein